MNAFRWGLVGTPLVRVADASIEAASMEDQSSLLRPRGLTTSCCVIRSHLSFLFEVVLQMAQPL